MATKEFKILKMTAKPADDRNKYPQYEMEIENENGKVAKAYAGQGKWNSHWVEGGIGKAEVWNKTSKATGNPYVQLKCPEDMKPKGTFAGQQVPSAIEDRVTVLERQIKDLQAFMKGKDDVEQPEPPETTEQPEPPKDEEEVSISDIPF